MGFNHDFHFCRQAKDITWEEFKVEFNGKYFPPEGFRKRKERDFQTLRQGLIAVGNYEARFRTLEMFAPDLVPTKRWRVKCFYEGLHYEIHMTLIDRSFGTFGDVV